MTTTESQLHRAIQDLFIAGTESVSTTLKWAILFMTIHEDIQLKVQQEIGWKLCIIIIANNNYQFVMQIDIISAA